MHELRTIAIDDFVHLSVYYAVCCANTAERIEVLFGVETLGDPRNIVLDGSPDFYHGFDAAFTKLNWPLVSV